LPWAIKTTFLRYRHTQKEEKMKHILLYVFLPILSVLMLCGCEPEVPEVEQPLYPTVGAINARFSVGDSVTVVFSQGNLQYQATTHLWRFANNQYDVIGTGNVLIDTTNSSWIDLFGWGTSGYNDLMPYATDDTNTHYATGENDIAGTEYDWGQHNAISNGGNKVGEWRTLTYQEWQHLLYYRRSASLLRSMATIERVGPAGSDMGGIVLLPDKWELPTGVTFKPGSTEGFQTNVYTAGDWNLMQSAGAVFLPAGGYRDGTNVNLVGTYGCYWTSTCYTDDSAYELYFQSSGYDFYTTARASGHCVRLVMNK
jgi:hypothetical protein